MLQLLSGPTVHLHHALQTVVLAAFDDLLPTTLAAFSLNLAQLPLALPGDGQRGELILDGLDHVKNQWGASRMDANARFCDLQARQCILTRNGSLHRCLEIRRGMISCVFHALIWQQEFVVLQ